MLIEMSCENEQDMPSAFVSARYFSALVVCENPVVEKAAKRTVETKTARKYVLPIASNLLKVVL
jgi:hypothetical protein